MQLLLADGLSRRASGIADPIARLRYLRAATASERNPAKFAVFVLLALSFLSPGRTLKTAPPRDAAALPTLVVDKVVDNVVNTKVWLVEERGSTELYSNGLQIDIAPSVNYHRRAYVAFDSNDRVTRLTQPSGIVFHSTESEALPFEPGQNRSLLQTTDALIDFVQRHHAYHYLIDRFGRVHRIVAESDSADHAGNAVWRCPGGVCLNLNHAFLGVAFETRTGAPLTTAQVHAGRVLTDMLRAKYAIDSSNCVTHSQVSINPANRRVGWHTDWADNFPFALLGLPRNYNQALAAVTEFGFHADDTYLGQAGEDLWVGIHRSEVALRDRARAAGEEATVYRRRLARRFDSLYK